MHVLSCDIHPIEQQKWGAETVDETHSRNPTGRSAFDGYLQAREHHAHSAGYVTLKGTLFPRGPSEWQERILQWP